jgi:3-phenylpropionate/trans-cinnamate dioxygenase ferredoxin subunit
MAEAFIPVAKVNEVPEGGMTCVKAGGVGLVLCRVEGTVYAVGDVCTHDAGPLCGGSLDGHAIECPRHGARFDVRDGKVLAFPAAVPIPSVPVRIDGDQIAVRVEPVSP